MTQDAQAAFFSYCREDSEFALRLAGDLKAAGASVWLDQVDIAPGQRWDRAVEDALKSCPQMLVILSPASVDSTNVMDEVSFALEEQKTVIPVIYRDCAVPFRLRRVQHVDFGKDYPRGFQALLGILVPGQNAQQSRSAMADVDRQRPQGAPEADERQLAVSLGGPEDEPRKSAKQAERAQSDVGRAVHAIQKKWTWWAGFNLSIIIIATGSWAVYRYLSLATLKSSAGNSATGQWNSRFSGTPNDLRSVFKTSKDNRLLAVGYESTVLESDDGEHWNARTGGTTLDPERRTFVVDSDISAVANGQECGLTAGDVITRLTDTPDADNMVDANVAASKKSDCAAGHTVAVNVDDLQKMRNRFEEQIDLGLAELAKKQGSGGAPGSKPTRRSNLSSIFGTSDGKLLWAVGSEGTILESDDGAEHWEPRDSGTRDWLHSIFGKADGNRLWAVGGEGTILESSDGGKSWGRRTSGTTSTLYSIFGTGDGNRLWVVGGEGTILESNNGGESWNRRSSGVTSTFYSIFGTGDGRRLWAVGGGGTILQWDDGGATWDSRNSRTPRHLYSIFGTSDGKRLWAVGYGGTILESDDGGDRWNSRNSGTQNNLDWISGTSDGGRLWAVGDKGTILQTGDP